MFKKKTGTVPVVVERFTPPMSEKEVRAALAGHRNDPKVKALMQILAVSLGEVRQNAESEQPLGEMRTYYNGGAAALALLMDQLRELVGGEG